MSNEMDYNFVFTWKIINYSLCGDKCFSSPVFTADFVKRDKWQIKLYPKGTAKNCNRQILYLTLFHADVFDRDIIIDSKVEQIGVNGEIYDSSIFNFNYSVRPSEGWPHFFPVKTLENHLRDAPKDELIIRYSFIKKKQLNKLSTSVQAVTVIDASRCSFRWNVSCPSDTVWLESEVFSFPDGSSLRLEITCPVDDILMTCQINKFKFLPRIVVSKISFLDINEIKKFVQITSFSFTCKNNVKKFPTLCKMSLLQEDDFMFLKGESLNLMCEFSISSSSKLQQSLEYNYYSPDKMTLDSGTVSPSTCEVLDNNLKMGDFNLILRTGGMNFPVHKFVLDVQSPLFSLMVQQRREVRKGVIDMTGFEKEILASFLTFLYKGKLDKVDQSKALKLLVMADKYQVLSLFESCLSFISTTTCESNVYEILKFADENKHDFLKTFAINFIKTHSGQILISEEWLEFIKNNYKLGIEILHQIAIQIENLEV